PGPVELGDRFPPGDALGFLQPVGPGEGVGGQLLFEGRQLLGRHAPVHGRVVQAEGNARLNDARAAITARHLGQQVETALLSGDAGHKASTTKTGRSYGAYARPVHNGRHKGPLVALAVTSAGFC
ncbi:MAG: hypothetical protein ACK559_09275, partial [bacterium]